MSSQAFLKLPGLEDLTAASSDDVAEALLQRMGLAYEEDKKQADSWESSKLQHARSKVAFHDQLSFMFSCNEVCVPILICTWFALHVMQVDAMIEDSGFVHDICTFLSDNTNTDLSVKFQPAYQETFREVSKQLSSWPAERLAQKRQVLGSMAMATMKVNPQTWLE